MKNKTLITLLILSLLLTSCSQPAQPEEIAPEPTSVPATEVPTATPEPTPTEERIESGFFTYNDNTWSPIYVDEMTAPVFLPEEMVGSDVDAMQLVQYGYFDAYNEKDRVLTAYARLMPGEVYRKLDFSVLKQVRVICLPEMIEDTPITGISYLPVNGLVAFPQGKDSQIFSNIFSKLDTNTYMVFVLPNPVNGEVVNQISQLAAICP